MDGSRKLPAMQGVFPLIYRQTGELKSAPPPILACLKAGTFRLVCLCGIAPCNSDVLCHTELILIVNAVFCLAGHLQLALRCFEQVCKDSALLFIEACTAGIALLHCGLSIYGDGAAAALRCEHILLRYSQVWSSHIPPLSWRFYFEIRRYLFPPGPCQGFCGFRIIM